MRACQSPARRTSRSGRPERRLDLGGTNILTTIYDRCPSCGANDENIAAFATCFEIFECDKRDRRFCFKCPGSNGGRDCPDCDTDDPSVVGPVSPIADAGIARLGCRADSNAPPSVVPSRYLGRTC